MLYVKMRVRIVINKDMICKFSKEFECYILQRKLFINYRLLFGVIIYVFGLLSLLSNNTKKALNLEEEEKNVS